jgi:hypothetical protein
MNPAHELWTVTWVGPLWTMAVMGSASEHGLHLVHRVLRWARAHHEGAGWRRRSQGCSLEV